MYIDTGPSTLLIYWNSHFFVMDLNDSNSFCITATYMYDILISVLCVLTDWVKNDDNIAILHVKLFFKRTLSVIEKRKLFGNLFWNFSLSYILLLGIEKCISDVLRSDLIYTSMDDRSIPADGVPLTHWMYIWKLFTVINWRLNNNTTPHFFENPL